MLSFSFLLYSNQHPIIRVEFRHASSTSMTHVSIMVELFLLFLLGLATCRHCRCFDSKGWWQLALKDIKQNMHGFARVCSVQNEWHSSQLRPGCMSESVPTLVVAHQNDLNLGELLQHNVQSDNIQTVVASTLLVLFVCLFVNKLMLIQRVHLAFEPGEVLHLCLY